MQAIKFSLAGNTTLSLDPPALYPVDLESKVGVSVVRLAAGGSKRYNHSIPIILYRMEWTKDRPLSIQSLLGGYNFSTGLQAANTQSLINWWINVAVGPLNSFTYTDQDGVGKTIHFEKDSFRFKKMPGAGYIGGVTLVFEG